ncbi:UDP-3-O-acyl-N-acetylglucosamine deacetylase [Alphaproteobacteria bacterium]|nr:UDP-3-O-acyl-N-acetylglucosamine deacetylase [Alphaproteobacteria bacterium]
MFQRTIKNSISLTGIGIHSGAPVTLTLTPASIDHGLVFQRTDLAAGQNEIPALWSYVTDTKLCTKISNSAGASVGTIEHLISALSAQKVDNLLIKLDGPEVPIMDGSAQPFWDLIEEAGVETQTAARSYIKVLKKIKVEGVGDTWAEIRPTASPCLSVHYTFLNRALDTLETYQSDDVLSDFQGNLASARTFGFLEEVEKLRQMGLAKGGSLENAVVFDQGKILNDEGLRFSDECARHKALDVVGDLYLAGFPLVGAFEGYCSGHALNNALIRKVLNDKSAWTIETKPHLQKSSSHAFPVKNKDLSDPAPRFGTY